MRNGNSANLIRLAAPLLALCIAGTALAEPRSGGSGQTKADCYNQAALQLSIEYAQCAGYPGGSTAYNYCQAEVAQHYSLAIAACEGASEASLKQGSHMGTAPASQNVGAGLAGRALSTGRRLSRAATLPTFNLRRR